MHDPGSAVDRSRRRLVQGAGISLLAIATGQAHAAAPASKRSISGSRLVLLGTAGGPSPKLDRSAPANAIVISDDIYVIDCGNGVARQMVKAGLDLGRIHDVFITHQHSDHNADHGNLLLLASTNSTCYRMRPYCCGDHAAPRTQDGPGGNNSIAITIASSRPRRAG